MQTKGQTDEPKSMDLYCTRDDLKASCHDVPSLGAYTIAWSVYTATSLTSQMRENRLEIQDSQQRLRDESHIWLQTKEDFRCFRRQMKHYKLHFQTIGHRKNFEHVC